MTALLLAAFMAASSEPAFASARPESASLVTDSVSSGHVDPTPTGREGDEPPAAAPSPAAPADARQLDSALPLPDLASIQTDSGILLGLDSIQELALAGNHDIRQARSRWEAAHEAARGSWGTYEPRLVGRFNHQETDIPGPLQERREDWKLSFQGQLPTATQYDLGMRHTNNLYSSTLSDVFAGASLRQPVLRGAWYGAPLAPVRIARAEERKAYHEYRARIAGVITKVHEAFWDCVYASQRLHFEEQSVKVALDLQRDGVHRIAAGKISPLDLEKITSELAIRLSRRIDAQRGSLEARNRLTSLISSPERPWMESVRLDLAQGWRMDTLGLPTTPDDDSFNLWNPDIQAQKAEIARLDLRLGLRRDARLPSVDLTGSYGYYASGRSGPLARAEFESRPGTQVSAGVEIEIPVAGNLKEIHQARSEALELRAARTRLSQIEIQARKNQVDLVRNVRQSLLQSQQERTAVLFHEKELAAEFRKLAAGKSNYHLLYDIEEKLRESQRKLLEVVRDYHLARVELERTRGRLLSNSALERLEDDRPRLVRRLLIAPPESR
jgi:outer membrane protein TolC